MRKILVFIKCALGETYHVANEIVNSDLACSVDSISGTYDLFLQFHLEDDCDVGRMINSELHSINGIRDTETVICFNPFTKDAGLGESLG